jgi:hypothetical protein
MLKVDGMDDKYRKNGALGKGASEELQLKGGVLSKSRNCLV